LHGHGCVSADLDLANLNLPCFPSRDVHDKCASGTFAFLLVHFSLD